MYKENDDKELIYLAGLFDGEGCACVTREITPTRRPIRYKCLLTLQMTDSEPVKAMADYFGGGITYRDLSKLRRKNAYKWTARGQKAGVAAKALLPFVKIMRKKEVLKAVIEFAQTILPRGVVTGTEKYATRLMEDTIVARENLYLRCTSLNARGIDADNCTPIAIKGIIDKVSIPKQLFLF